MTWLVKISDSAEILSDFGVVVNEKFLELPEAERERLLRYGLALRQRALDLHIEYESFDWWRGAQRSLAHFEQALDDLERQKALAEAKKKAKSVHVARRRAAFNAVRSELVLEMLDAGVDYVCAAPGCSVCSDLTVDHVKPISRGGTDDLSNLQFMCRSHNSAKGDRP